MRVSLLILFFGLLAVNALAQDMRQPKEIAGEISGFLKATESPYLVTGTIVVNENEALMVDAGVTIYFKAGTGLDIRGGSFAAIGNETMPVQMQAFEANTQWNGISYTGEEPADLNFVQISDAEVAFAIENASADIRNATFTNSGVGVYAGSANVNIQGSKFSGIQGAATAATGNSYVTLNSVKISESNIALYAGHGTQFNLINSEIQKNQYGLLDQGDNEIKARNSSVAGNGVAIVSRDIPTDEVKAMFNGNSQDLSENVEFVRASIPAFPKNEFAQKYKAVQNQVQKNSWNLTGNVSTIVGYHLVRTRHNHTGEDYIVGQDTIKNGDRYENYFQEPGLFSNYNTYLKLETPSGKTLEFSTDIYSNHWNELNVRSINATLSDASDRLSIGDTYISAGETYLAGINIFGASYDTKLFWVSNDRALFNMSLFAGESNKPQLVGAKNPDIYKDWIEEGEAEAQELVAGGKLTWNMHKRFNGTLGFIGSKDFTNDPFLRDGMSESHNTIDPKITSRTFFAEGNWLFWPGDIELNGQIALGAADTSNVKAQRAINQVFSDAGISVANFALLRKLMKNETAIDRLRRSELEEIFGDNTMLTEDEMTGILHRLIAKAKQIEKYSEDKEDDQSKFDEWDGQNYAVAASLRWSLARTVLGAHVKYVGSKFYSAGSPDQVGNTREIGASLDQKIMNFWFLNLAYDLNIENASIGNKYNVFGIREGTTIGLVNNVSSKWLAEHEQDEIRTNYIHNASVKNLFKIGGAELTLKYKMDYRTRSRSTRLYANYDIESDVYEDPWFKVKSRGKQSYYTLERENDTLFVDSAKFVEYYGLKDYEYLASGFNERTLKHTAEAEIAYRWSKNTFKIGAIVAYRTDLSEFENDSLLDNFDFSDKTLGYLGYYFHGGDFIEQRYPISLTTNIDWFSNQISIVPRYKMYNRDSMKELEYSIGEKIGIAFVPEFLELTIGGDITQEFIRRHSDGKNEMQADIDGFATLRVHYTKDLYSDYTIGSYYNYRPDSRADEYKDYYAQFSLNYDF